MTRMKWPALAGFLLCCAVLRSTSLPAGETIASTPAAPSTVYLFCVGIQPKHQLPDESMVLDAVFYSGVFSVTSDLMQSVNEGFLKYLEEQHGFHSSPSLVQPVTCHSRNSLAEAQADRQKLLSQSQKYSHRQQVVDTGWTYGSAETKAP